MKNYIDNSCLMDGLQEKLHSQLHPSTPSYELPSQDEETASSDYLTSHVDEIRTRGMSMIQTEIDLYDSEIAKLERIPQFLSFVTTFFGLTISIAVISAIVYICAGLIWAILCAIFLIFLGYSFFGIVFILIEMQFLGSRTDQIKTLASEFSKKIDNTINLLNGEITSTKEMYFNSVINAQFKYGKNNQGIGVLADWCCQHIMDAIKKGDHRQFQSQVKGKISYEILFDRVNLTPTIFAAASNDMTLDAHALKTGDLSVFILQEHCIYNMENDLFTTTGCAQALCAHIKEKMPSTLAANGYNSTITFVFISNDNHVDITITVHNPKFIPFQEM